VAECARLAGVTTATLYRWLKRYQRSGRVSALVPSISSGGRGQGRLSHEAEAIIQATTEEVYLSQQKPSAQYVCVEVLRRCRNAGVTPPSHFRSPPPRSLEVLGVEGHLVFMLFVSWWFDRRPEGFVHLNSESDLRQMGHL
jgi:Helix-turn-helix domain